MSKEKTKEILVWGIGIAVALASVIVGYPTFIFALFPFSPAILAVYAALATFFPTVYFHNKKRAFAVVSFALFLLPVLILVFVVVGINVGFLEWL